jgi:catechol 2,3-dioxygenase-like lactoylglutathione lyase family enzyme
MWGSRIGLNLTPILTSFRPIDQFGILSRFEVPRQPTSSTKSKAAILTSDVSPAYKGLLQEGRCAMAKIKHIAIRTRNVEETARFYKEVFGLNQTGLGRSGVYLSDGDINLAILNVKEGATPRVGLDHLGFQVDELEGTMERARRLGGKPLTEMVKATPTDPSNPQSYFEVKCEGPDGQEIDLSTVGWAGNG